MNTPSKSPKPSKSPALKLTIKPPQLLLPTLTYFESIITKERSHQPCCHPID